MDIAEKNICEVCNVDESVGVGASPLAPWSFAYCKKCWQNNAQPLWVIKAAIEMECGGGLDGITYYENGKYKECSCLLK